MRKRDGRAVGGRGGRARQTAASARAQASPKGGSAVSGKNEARGQVSPPRSQRRGPAQLPRGPARPLAGDREPAVRDRLVVKIHPTSSAKKCAPPTSADTFTLLPPSPPAPPALPARQAPLLSPALVLPQGSQPQARQLHALQEGGGGEGGASSGRSRVQSRRVGAGFHIAGSDSQRKGGKDRVWGVVKGSRLRGGRAGWRATGSREGSQCRVAGRVHLRTLRRLTPAQPEGGAPQPRAGGTDLPPGPGTEGSARARAPRGKLRLAATLRVRGRGGNTAPRARVCVRGCWCAGGNTPYGGRDGSFRTAPDSDPPARAGSLAPKAQLAVRGQDSSDTRRQGTEREA